MLSNVLYSTHEQRMDSMIGGFTTTEIQMWQSIKRAQDYYTKELSQKYTTEQFMAWIQEEYGIKLYKSEMGYTSFGIVDENKHLLFMLKFVK